MSSDSTRQTDKVLAHHLQAVFDEDVEEILKDYTEDSTLYLAQGPVKGIAHLRSFFSDFLTNKPEKFVENFQIMRQDVEGEIAYIVWQSEPDIPLGTDTFLVRNGKILVQTFAAHLAPRDM